MRLFVNEAASFPIFHFFLKVNLVYLGASLSSRRTASSSFDSNWCSSDNLHRSLSNHCEKKCQESVFQCQKSWLIFAHRGSKPLIKIWLTWRFGNFCFERSLLQLNTSSWLKNTRILYKCAGQFAYWWIILFIIITGLMNETLDTRTYSIWNNCVAATVRKLQSNRNSSRSGMYMSHPLLAVVYYVLMPV